MYVYVIGLLENRTTSDKQTWVVREKRNEIVFFFFFPRENRKVRIDNVLNRGQNMKYFIFLFFLPEYPHPPVVCISDFVWTIFARP